VHNKTNKTKEKTMKMKYMEKPTYPEVEVIGKTVESATGTIDRRKFGRLLITEEAGFGTDGDKKNRVVLNGDDATIQTVEKVAEIEVIVKLVDDSKSAASFTFFDAFKAKNAENPDILDIFTVDGDKIERAVACAERMCEANPGCDDQYKFVDKATGTRVFLRRFEKNLTENGKVARD